MTASRKQFHAQKGGVVMEGEIPPYSSSLTVSYQFLTAIIYFMVVVM